MLRLCIHDYNRGDDSCQIAETEKERMRWQKQGMKTLL
uniref:Uncharacterized protein n=1 Tax=Klebsiella phage vB_KpnM_Iguana_ER37 TaxID=3076781 RepID=A0AB38Z442_9CAUD|nr:MAG TPA: hypothetical protein [Caudoviricetes sp.]